MKDNFYISYAVGTLIGLLICLIGLLFYVIVTEAEEEIEIKEAHALLEEKIDYITDNMVTQEQWAEGLIINIE